MVSLSTVLSEDGQSSESELVIVVQRLPVDSLPDSHTATDCPGVNAG
jgi:hypothetical protein